MWTDRERAEVTRGAEPNRVLFLNPDDPLVRAEETIAQFGRDMYQVMIATAVVVDARERRGIGVGVEMAAAAALGTPVIAVAPPETVYRRQTLTYRNAVVHGYVHPHLASLTTLIVDSFSEAGAQLINCRTERHRTVPMWLRDGIESYESEILPFDDPMKEVVALLHRSPSSR